MPNISKHVAEAIIRFQLEAIFSTESGCWSCAVQRCAAAMRGQHELESFAKPLCNMETSKRCQQKLHRTWNIELEALAMDNCRSLLIIFCLGNPHLLKGAKRWKYWATNPHTVLPLGWSNHLDAHSGRCKSTKFLCHSLADAWHHGWTTWEHHVGEEISTNVHIALHDGLKCRVMNSHGLFSNQTWLEEDFWTTKTFCVDGNDVAIWQLVGLWTISAHASSLQLTVKV